MTDRNDGVRELAYFLWLEEGCRDGWTELHWLVAENPHRFRAARAEAHRRRTPGDSADDSLTVPGIPGGGCRSRSFDSSAAHSGGGPLQKEWHPFTQKISDAPASDFFQFPSLETSRGRERAASVFKLDPPPMGLVCAAVIRLLSRTRP
jgi:hypothetical protein